MEKRTKPVIEKRKVYDYAERQKTTKSSKSSFSLALDSFYSILEEFGFLI